MHINAKTWDNLPRNMQKWVLVPVFKGEQGELKEVPSGRPCDWCGEPVETGYLHDGECAKADMEFWLDILY